jgi:hypothetical protein
MFSPLMVVFMAKACSGLGLVGEDDLHPGGVKGHLPIQGRERGEDLRCSGMVGGNVPHVPNKGEQMVRAVSKGY